MAEDLHAHPSLVDKSLNARPLGNPQRPPMRPDTRNIHVPIDAHEKAIVGDGPSAAAGRLALAQVHGAWTSIANAAADPDVDQSRLANASRKAMNEALQGVERAAGNIASHLDVLQRDIDRAVMPRTDATLAAEIRSHLKASGNIGELLMAVQRDPRVSSAVLSAPPFLSGLDPTKVDEVRDVAELAHSPDQREQREEASKAFYKLNAATSSFKQDLEPRLAKWEVAPHPGLEALEGGKR